MLELEWENRAFLLNGKSHVPKVWDGQPKEQVPEGFNAVVIKLDARIDSKLRWEKELSWARECISKGLHILWELDLGIPTELKQPLSSETQFRALALAIEHFVNNVWTHYQNESIGAILYRGSLDFSHGFNWSPEQKAQFKDWLEDRELEYDEPMKLKQKNDGYAYIRLYCRDVIVQYLDLLTTKLPPTLLAFALVDSRGIGNLALQASLLSREAFEHIHPIPMGAAGGFCGLCWEPPEIGVGFIGRKMPEPSAQKEIKTGICLPHKSKLSWDIMIRLSAVVGDLEKNATPYRYIPESHIIYDWDGLDDLLVDTEGVSRSGERKLDGFRAAGGHVRSL